MAKNKVDLQGINTNELKVLTNEEQIALFSMLKKGDIQARTKLIEGNLKLVLAILKKFTNRCDNMNDLFQIGCIGLVKAIDNFSLDYNVRFSTYGVPMILGEIKRYLRDNNQLRVSRSIKDLAYKSIKVKEELSQLYNRIPTTKEISDELNVTEYEIITAMDSLREPISMFEPTYNDGGDVLFLYDHLEDKKQNIDIDTNLSVSQAIKTLKPREQSLLKDRFIIGKTQMEVAKELGISQAQISRLESGAIKNLKKILKY